MKVEISALVRGSLTVVASNKATRRVSAGVDVGRAQRQRDGDQIIQVRPSAAISQHARIKVREQQHGQQRVMGKYLDSCVVYFDLCGYVSWSLVREDLGRTFDRLHARLSENL